jgi:hypothetical protein
MNCPAHIRISAIRLTQKLVITEFNDQHNHEISRNDYIYYNKNRAVNKADTETKNELEDMIKSKANPRLVLKFLTEKTGRVENLRAINNFKISLKLRGNYFSIRIVNLSL